MKCSRLERSKTIPANMLEIMADYFNTSIDYLLKITDEIKPYPKSKLIKEPTLKLYEYKKQKKEI